MEKNKNDMIKYLEKILMEKESIIAAQEIQIRDMIKEIDNLKWELLNLKIVEKKNEHNSI